MLPRLRRFSFLIAPAVAAACAVAPASAHAGLFAGDPIVGPSPDVVALGDVDMARDGTGALTFISREGGIARAFVSRFVNGAFIGAERVDAGLELPVTQAVVAASNGGRVVAVFAAGPSIYAAVRPSGALPWSAPVAIGSGADPSVAMSLTGTAYASFSGNGDVGLARLDRTTNVWAAVPGAIDVDPARAAGGGTGRSRVAISADGVGIVVWGEDGADGRTHVYARKVFGLRPSDRPQDLTLTELEGRPALGADTPEVDAEDDSSFAWVAFRQAITDSNGATRLRTVARRQRGTEFDPAVVVDSQGVPADEDTRTPHIDLNGRGEGVASLTGVSSNQPIAALLRGDLFARGQRYGTTGSVPAAAVTVVAENSDALLAWVHAPGTDQPALRVRAFDKFVAQPETPLSKPELGPVDPALGLDAATDRAGSAVVAWVQNSVSQPGARSIVAGYLDQAPRSFAGQTATQFRRLSQPTLAWSEAVDLWGPLTYRVLLDGAPAGDVAGVQSWQPTSPLPDGVYRWQVQAIDRRGQTTTTRSRPLRVDTTAPELTLRVSGTRKAGRALKFTFRAADVQVPSGSAGLARVRFAWGDGTETVTSGFGGTVTHRFRRGRVTVRVTATDKAQNVTALTRTLRIAKR